MRISHHASLNALNTFGVEAAAGSVVTLDTEEDLVSMPTFDPERDVVLGGGSNVLLVSDVPGSVFLNRLKGVAVVDQGEDHAVVEAGAGENWHELVRWTLGQGLSGLENLSLIPGSVGAAPIQNIGAYGVELDSVLETVTAWDLVRNRWSTFNLEACGLAYRDSRFKSREPGRFLISSVRLRLDRHFSPQLDYSGLREELERRGIHEPTAMQVSDAVISLRRRRLPDPEVIANAGSFFKNPVLQAGRAGELTGRHPQLPAWPQADGSIKLSAAWMIEYCGFKGYREGDAGVSERHALVLVNYGSASGREIFDLSVKIQDAIQAEFGVRLEPEPRILNFSI